MTSILDQAQRDLRLARSEASNAQRIFKAAVAKVRAAEQRVQRLEITQMETDLLMSELRRRARAGR
jgi:hypothetical protein